VFIALAIAAVHTLNIISAGLNALHRFLIGRSSGQAAPEYRYRSDRSSSAAAWPSESADSDTGRVVDEWGTCGARQRSSETFLPPWLQFRCTAMNHPDVVANGSVAGTPWLLCIAVRSQTAYRNNKSLTALS